MIDNEELRSIAAKASCQAEDRAGIQVTANRIPHSMANPKGSSWAKLQRLPRDLVGTLGFAWGWRGRTMKSLMCTWTWTRQDACGHRSISGGLVAIGGEF